MSSINRLFLIVFAFLFIGCASTTIRHTKGYETAINSNMKITVLPPEARVYEVDAAGKNKRLYDFEFNVESIISEEVLLALEEKGIRAKLLTRRNVHDLKLNEEVDILESRFFEVENKLYEKVKEKEEKAFNIDSNVGYLTKNLIEKEHSDILILIGYSRSIKSSGSQALGFMSAALFGAHTTPADMSTLRIAFVESRTGRVLWVNKIGNIHASFFSSAQKDEERKIMKKYLSSLLEKFNKISI